MYGEIVASESRSQLFVCFEIPINGHRNIISVAELNLIRDTEISLMWIKINFPNANAYVSGE